MKWKSYEYEGKNDQCQSSNCTPIVKLDSCTDVDKSNQLALMEAVSKQPVSVAIEADTFLFQLYTSGVITDVKCGTNLDHAVLIVGYGTEDNTDYWLVKNSWGDEWGDHGYVKILRKIIEQNNLKDFDNAKLLPSSLELESLI